MEDFFTMIKEKVGVIIAKSRKYFLLGALVVSAVLMLVTMLVPYISYGTVTGEEETIVPIKMFSLLFDVKNWEHYTAYIGLAIFLAGIVMLGVALLFLGKGVLSFFYDENRLAKYARKTVLLSVAMTCVYYLSSIIICSLMRIFDVTQGIHAVHSGALFILALVFYVIYMVAATFLNKENAPKTEKDEELGSVKQQWIRKGIFLALAAASVVVVICLYFVAFCQYKAVASRKYVNLYPIQILYFLRQGGTLSNNMICSAMATFVGITIAIVIVLKYFAGCVTKIFSDEKLLVEASKKTIIFATVFTAIYFIGGIIASSVFYMTGAAVFVASNFIPLIITACLLVAHAIMLGIYRKLYLVKKEEKEQVDVKKEKRRKKRKVLYRARIELFVCAMLITAFSVVALLTNILTISFGEQVLPEFLDIKLPNIKLIGYDLIKNYLILDKGAQTIAFIIIALLSLIAVSFFFTLISFLSRSNVFYKVALTAVTVCTIATFLVGMFGKYYEVVQALDEGILKGYVSSYFKDEEWLNEMLAWGLEYKVESDALYYSLGSAVVITYLLFRNPYTKGITVEREYALMEESEVPQTIEGEISLKDLPEELLTTRNDGTVIVEDVATKEEKVFFADPCPIFTELDAKIPQYQEELAKKREELFDKPTLPKLVQFVVQYARDSRLHLSYTEEDIATFVAGLGTTKLTILQGMSGTGKTSLPKIFAEALHATCEIIEVESSWRDKNELLGYYNEFSKNFTPKKFTQALYRAKLNADTLTFIVLDEMNLSRIEYYFSDFLSLMENEPDKRELRLLNVCLMRTEEGEKVPYEGLFEGHTIKIPGNVWFIGTANRDESTFEISDKVYDRAHTMNFNKRAPKVLHYNDPVPQKFLPVDMLEKLFAKAKEKVKFNIDEYPVIGEVEKLLAPYNISFGNRIAMQIESFVNVYSSCFASSDKVIHSAVEKILLSKVVSKLELKSVENKELLAAEFEKLNLHECSKFILKLNED